MMALAHTIPDPSLQILGCIVIGYMSWVLASSVTVSRFLDGTLVRELTSFKC